MIKLFIALTFSSFIFQSCSSSFDIKKAQQKVDLSKDDIKIYNEFYQSISEDLLEIRSKMKSYHVGDTALIGINSYYLYQIDSLKYSRIISELRKRGIYSDNIEISTTGMVVFRLKDMTNIKWDDYNDSHIHEIAYCFNENEYGNNINIITDSLINKNLRYIYFRANTGH